MDTIPSMLAKLVHILSLDFQSIKRKILPWENILLNVAVTFESDTLDACCGAEKLMMIIEPI